MRVCVEGADKVEMVLEEEGQVARERGVDRVDEDGRAC